MSGLEFIQAMIDGKLPSPDDGRHCSERISAVDRGHVTFKARATRHLNPLGGVHGDFQPRPRFSDGCASTTMLEAASLRTIDLNVKMLKPSHSTRS